jgi:hypothetical protein
MTYETILERMAAIHRAKNTDYGNSYELSARLLGRPVVEGLLHRMSDKLSRACKLAQGQKAQVQDEPLTDTLIDLANYAVLAILALESSEENGCKCSGLCNGGKDGHANH